MLEHIIGSLLSAQAATGPLLALTDTKTGTNLDNYNAGVNFGDAGADRLCILALFWYNGASRVIDSVSIGGVSATILTNNSSANSGVVIVQALVPTGSGNLTVQVDVSGTTSNYVMIAHTLRNYASSTPVDSNAASGTSPLAANLSSAAAGGVLLAAANVRSAQTWTGPTENASASSGNVNASTAVKKPTVAGSEAVGVSWGSFSGKLAAVAWA